MSTGPSKRGHGLSPPWAMSCRRARHTQSRGSRPGRWSAAGLGLPPGCPPCRCRPPPRSSSELVSGCSPGRALAGGRLRLDPARSEASTSGRFTLDGVAVGEMGNFAPGSRRARLSSASYLQERGSVGDRVAPRGKHAGPGAYPIGCPASQPGRHSKNAAP